MRQAMMIHACKRTVELISIVFFVQIYVQNIKTILCIFLTESEQNSIINTYEFYKLLLCNATYIIKYLQN